MPLTEHLLVFPCRVTWHFVEFCNSRYYPHKRIKCWLQKNGPSPRASTRSAINLRLIDFSAPNCHWLICRLHALRPLARWHHKTHLNCTIIARSPTNTWFLRSVMYRNGRDYYAIWIFKHSCATIQHLLWEGRYRCFSVNRKVWANDERTMWQQLWQTANVRKIRTWKLFTDRREGSPLVLGSKLTQRTLPPCWLTEKQ